MSGTAVVNHSAPVQKRRSHLLPCGIMLLPLALALAPATAECQLEVDQLEVVLRTTGSEVSETFTVRNTSDDAVTARLSPGDWDRAADGTNRFLESGVLKGSCNPRIEIFPATVRLEPSQSQTIRVTYKGGELQTSCWSTVMVETAPVPSRSAEGAQLMVQLRTAVKIYAENPAARAAIDITELDAGPHVPPRGSPVSDSLGSDIIARVINKGGVQARVKGRVEYRSLSDAVVARSALDEFPVLPGAERVLRVRMPQLAPGSYVALLLLDAGGSEIVAAQLELDITS